MGDQDDPESDDEALGESKGWRSTSDWVPWLQKTATRQCLEAISPGASSNRGGGDDVCFPNDGKVRRRQRGAAF